jgi:hypothetical protein
VVGLIYPIVVKPDSEHDGQFRIIAGERRWEKCEGRRAKYEGRGVRPITEVRRTKSEGRKTRGVTDRTVFCLWP